MTIPNQKWPGRVLAGVQLAGLAAVWLVVAAPAALVAGGAVVVNALKGPRAVL